MVASLIVVCTFWLQRSIQEIITQDNDLDSDVGMNLIQLLGGSNDFYGTKRRRSSCTSASSEDSILSGRSAASSDILTCMLARFEDLVGGIQRQ